MKRIHKCRWNKKIGGVCGGFGQYFQIDPTSIRFGLVCLAFITAVLPVVIAYIIAWAILPQGPGAYVEIKGPKLYRSKSGRQIGGVCGGIAEAMHTSPTLVRTIYIIAAILTGFIPLILAYIVGCVIIPERPI
jgi:phage shock protein C